MENITKTPEKRAELQDKALTILGNPTAEEQTAIKIQFEGLKNSLKDELKDELDNSASHREIVLIKDARTGLEIELGSHKEPLLQMVSIALGIKKEFFDNKEAEQKPSYT